MTGREDEEYITSILNQARDKIVARFPDLYALALVGSYGRGEGTVRKVEGQFEPANDLDFVLIFPGAITVEIRAAARELSDWLCGYLNVRHVDLITMSRADLSIAPPNMLRYDMRRGARVLHGHTEVLAQVPLSTPEPFRREEIRNLLINRMVTLLEGHPCVQNELPPEVKARQIAKVILAVVDAMLYEHGSYRTLYKQKVEELGKLATQHPKAEELLALGTWAFRAFMFELSIAQCSEEQLRERWSEASSWLLNSYLQCASSCDDRGYMHLSETFALWRGKKAFFELIPAIVATLKGREVRRAVEQRISLHIAQHEVSDSWNDEALELIRSWYNS